jgi:serine phosphatase RsbU (regulator of sigma subunit)
MNATITEAENKLPLARLSKRVIFFVFSSIIAIEGILLIPSVMQKDKDLIEQIREITAGKVAVAMQTVEPDASGQEILARVSKLENPNKPLPLNGQLKHIISGGALYTQDGQLVGTFGEKPELSFDKIHNQSQLNLRYDNGYDATWMPKKLGRDYILICRHDVSTVRSELNQYMLTISSLVVVISVFVTVSVWIALKPLLIKPILSLRSDLLNLGEAIGKDIEPPIFKSSFIKRKDELGDVIIAFNQMYGQISEAISKRKQAELELQDSLHKVRTYSQLLKNELKKGHEIQLNFLPDRNNIKELYHKFGWEIAAFFKPARQVAGDFYDLFELPHGNIGLVIADVCDKGVGAALFMAMFRSLIRIYSRQFQLTEGLTSTIILDSPTEMLRDRSQPNQSNKTVINTALVNPIVNPIHLKALEAVSLTNDYVSKHHGELGMFATLFFGVLDPTTGLLSYVNGGHEPPLIVSASGGVKENLKPSGPAVGMLPEVKFKIKQTYLEPGDIVFGYTDGVPEARNSKGKFFTKEGLMSSVNQPFSSAHALLEHISNLVQTHQGKAEQFDDITLIGMRWIQKNSAESQKTTLERNEGSKFKSQNLKLF